MDFSLSLIEQMSLLKDPVSGSLISWSQYSGPHEWLLKMACFWFRFCSLKNSTFSLSTKLIPLSVPYTHNSSTIISVTIPSHHFLALHSTNPMLTYHNHKPLICNTFLSSLHSLSKLTCEIFLFLLHILLDLLYQKCPLFD